jgi:hypothetical protein
MSVIFNKEKIVVEDIVLSMDTTVDQSRGTLTPFNAAYLPYSVSESVKTALDNRYTKSESDSKYANIGGNSSVQFDVANATSGTNAVTYTQLETGLSDLNSRKVEEGTVLRTDIDNDFYQPQYPNSPATKKYVDDQIEDKFLHAVTGYFMAKNSDGSGSDVLVTVTNGVITGIGV